MANDKKKRTFNLDKAEKRTFNLAKEDDEEIDVVVPEPTEPEAPESLTEPIKDGSDGGGKPPKKGVIAILAVCVLAAIGLLIWWLAPGNQKETVAPDSEGIADTATAPANTAQAPENTLPQEGSTTSDKASLSSSENVPAQENTPATSAPAEAPAEAPSGSIDEQAQKAIQGVYGNGLARRDNLGSSYREVQDRVNELLKK